MREFTSEGTFDIKGRGQAFAISAEQMPDDLWDPNYMYGEQVSIDGHTYTVKGVETFAIARSPEHPYRLGFSLLVKEGL